MNRSMMDASLCWLNRRKPDAVARVRGDKAHSDLKGVVRFYQSEEGVYVVSCFTGLPIETGACGDSIFAMHIHNGGSCTGTVEDPFANAGTHYNPKNCPHPEHAGDLPPLFGNQGRAWGAFLTSRFSVESILGNTVILHANPDDFTTQPSGNAGKKIACGVIRANCC